MSNALDRLVDKSMDHPNRQITNETSTALDQVTDSRLGRMEVNIEANAEMLTKILELLKSVSNRKTLIMY